MPFGAFGTTRGSGLARGKRPTPTAAPAAASATGAYQPTAIEVVTPQREYQNPFAPATPGQLPLAGLATVEEGSFVNGRWVPCRLFAGDSTDEGNAIRIPWAPGSWVPVYRQRSSPDAIQRVTLYRYR